MRNFKEFLNEASSKPTIKDKVLDTIKSKGGYNPETRGERSRFMRDMSSLGSDMSLGRVWDDLKKSGMLAGKTQQSKTPVATAKPLPKPNVKFDVDGIVKKYDQILKLLNEISSEGSKFKTQLSNLAGGKRIHNLETPELYTLSVMVSNAGYVSDIMEQVKERKWSVSKINDQIKKLPK